MTGWSAVLLALVAVAVLVAIVRARLRAAACEARRVEALGRLAERVERTLGQLHPPRPPHVEPTLAGAAAPVPLIADRLPGRAAFLDAVAAAVDAQPAEVRLTVAIARAASETTPEALADAVREATGQQAYAVGPTAVAFLLPGLGRAGALGALARIETLAASTGTAVERGTDESAVEVVARLLEHGAGLSRG